MMPKYYHHDEKGKFNKSFLSCEVQYSVCPYLWLSVLFWYTAARKACDICIPAWKKLHTLHAGWTKSLLLTTTTFPNKLKKDNLK